MVDADGFMLTNFHMDSCGIKVLISDRKVLVGSVCVCLKLLSFTKYFILELYCLVDKITMELPLSVRVNVASLFWSLDCPLFRALASCCLWMCLEFKSLFCFRVFTRSVTRRLYTSRSAVGCLILRFLLPKLCLVSNFSVLCVNYI
jgi:hypothetical protein